MLIPHIDPTFTPGQRWKLANASPDARLVILRVEQTHGGDVIVHAAAEGIEIKTATGTQSRIGHLPFAREAVATSVTVVDGMDEVPPYEDGYAIWREAFESGRGGFFSVSVAEAIEFVAKSLAAD